MTTLESEQATADRVVDALQADGYCIVRDLLASDELAAARRSLIGLLESTPSGRNRVEGYHTRRVYGLFAKTRAFDRPAVDPLLLGVLDRVLGHYQLSGPSGIQIDPGERAQVLHRDDVVYPLPADFPDVVVNTMWALDDFTEANGATRLVPGSHRWVDRRPTAADAPIVAEMPAGSVVFYLGGIWHGGGANTTDRPRVGVILEYVVSWLRAQETNLLAVPRRTAAALPERLQELLGYNLYPPFLGYVDGRHPRRWLADRAGARPEPPEAP